MVQSYENLRAMESSFINGDLAVPFKAIADGDRKAFKDCR